MKRILALVFILICFSSVAQVTTYPRNKPTVGSDSGWYSIGYIFPKVLSGLAVGDTAIRPSQNGASRLWFNAGVDTAVWAWSNTRWVKIASRSINWGSIGGNIHNQTDLITYIDSVFNVAASDSDHLVGVWPIILSRSNDTIYFALDPEFLAVTLTDGIKSGGYFSYSGTGLIYNITPVVYVKNATLYNLPATQITLTPAHPTNPRYDVPGVNTDPGYLVKEGDPEANPVIPQVDPATQLPLTAILVSAGATIPNVNVEVIYNENVEWTPTTSGTVSFSNTINPFNGVISADMSSQLVTRTVTFTKPSGTLDRTDFTLFKMYLDLKATIVAASNVQVRFYNGTVAVTPAITLAAGHGFTKTDVGYQNITIPLSSVAFSSNTFNRVVITFTGVQGGSYIDWVQLQGGIDPGGPATGVTIVTATNTYGLNWVITNPTTTPNLRATIDSSLFATHAFFYNKIDSLVLTMQAKLNGTGYVKMSGTTVSYRSNAQLTTDVNNFTTVLSGAVPAPTAVNGYFLKDDGTWAAVGGSGTLTDFTAGTLSPLFTTSVATSTTTPALTFALSNATAWQTFARHAGTTGAPSYGQLIAEHLNATYSNGNMLITNGSGVLSWTTAGTALNGTGYVLMAGTAPSYVPVIPISGGGTNNGSLAVTNGAILYGDGTKVISLPVGTAAQHLVGGTLPQWVDTATASASVGWTITGNAGTATPTNFLGTTDAKGFNIRTNNIVRVIVDSAGDCIPALGAEIFTAANWTSTNWTGSWATGWTHTTGNTSALTRTGNATVGTDYYLSWSMTGRTAGTVTLSYGGSSTIAASTSGEFGFRATATTTFAATPTSTFDGTLFLSLKTITGASIALAEIKGSQTTSPAQIQFRGDSSLNLGIGNLSLSKTVAGYGSTVNQNTGGANTGLGHLTLQNNISGYGNTGGGYNSLNALTTGFNNTGYGAGALAQLTTARGNVGMGTGAIQSTTGNYVVAIIGEASGASNTTSADNVIIAGQMQGVGDNPNRVVITGGGVSFSTVRPAAATEVGILAGAQNTGTELTAYGYKAASGIGTGGTSTVSNNATAIGVRSMGANGGTYNIALGFEAMWDGTRNSNNNTTGDGNLAAGYRAMGSRAAGSYNNAYGHQTMTTQTAGSYNQAYGAFVQMPSITGDGQLNIGNVLYGTGMYSTASNSSTPTTLGSIGIGLTTPTARLMLPAGTTTANTAPLKFTSGTVLTTAESGVLETNATNELFYTNSGAVRALVDKTSLLTTATGLTANTTHNTIVISATGQTITLPTAVGIDGRVYIIKLSASGSGTVATTSSQTIDGATTYSLASQYKYVTVQSDNANWHVIGNN